MSQSFSFSHGGLGWIEAVVVAFDASMLTTGLGYAFVCRGVFPTLPQTRDADMHVAKTSRGRVSMDGVMFAYLLINIYDHCPTWILDETSFSSTRSVCSVDCYDSATTSP